jgi:replication fork protection complex subunit Tof1/Swi1
MLGDDALACLKDLRRWIKLYDQKLNHLDVQRILAESNLVKGDLLEIVSSWAQSDKKNKLKTKISLKCCKFPE